jgi:hypothetical protein
MTERARRALEAVESDGAARDRLRAAWTLDADPVAALRVAAYVDEHTIAAAGAANARLRRLAFGRTSTPEEESAAADARAELATIEARAEQRRRAVEVAIDAVLDVPESEPADESVDETPVDDDAARRRGWVWPALAGVAVGATLAAGAVWSMGGAGVPAAVSSPTPTATALDYFLGDPPESTRGPGDLAAAEGWFTREQTEEDLVGVGELRPEFDRESVRLVHSSDAARVWLARQVDGKYCLETTETETQITNGTCVAADLFAEQGLTVSSNVLDAAWNGAQVRVVLASPRE